MQTRHISNSASRCQITVDDAHACLSAGAAHVGRGDRWQQRSGHEEGRGGVARRAGWPVPAPGAAQEADHPAAGHQMTIRGVSTMTPESLPIPEVPHGILCVD